MVNYFFIIFLEYKFAIPDAIIALGLNSGSNLIIEYVFQKNLRGINHDE